MKKITLLAALLLSITFYGQQKVANRVQELVQSNTVFRKFAPLTVAANPDSADLAKYVSNATFAAMNSALVNEIAANKYPAIELSIPYNGHNIAIQLYRADVFAKGFHVDTDSQRNVNYTPGTYYRGIVKGDDKSLVSFNFFEGEMNGVISAESVNNLVVGRLRTPGNTSNYIVYSDLQLNATSDFTCGVNESMPVSEWFPHAGKSALSVESAKCVTMYFEMDYDLYQQNNSSVSASNNWMTGVFNNVQTIYDNDGITISLKSVFVWTTRDPYSGTSSSDYLGEFGSTRPIFDGDVGQLVGIDPGGLGGVAAGIGSVCTHNNYSYADVDLAYNTVPTYSWTINVVAHENGHVLGSPHTHGCYWNGNNTRIDGCGQAAGITEGNCATGPIPQQGTMMSYCHLLGNVGVNLAFGFGPQPKQRILDHINSRTCIGTDCVNTCIASVTTINVADIDNTSIAITWTDAQAGPWEVGYSAMTSTVTNWTEVTTNTYTLTGLNPNTYYRFGVRPSCVDGIDQSSQEFIVATAADWCSGVAFYDTGGPNGNYANNQHLVRTIKPSAGNAVTVTFDSFEGEDNADNLYIYNGPSTTSPLLGMYTGIDGIDPVTSTAPDGSLTFEFVSNATSPRSGWSATTACRPLGTKDNTFATLDYYPNPTNGVVTIASPEGLTSITVYNIAGQLLMQKPVSGTTADADTSAFATGVYFFKVSNGTKEGNFRIVKQ